MPKYPDENEENLSQDQEKFLDEIDDIESPEQLEAAMKIYDEDNKVALESPNKDNFEEPVINKEEKIAVEPEQKETSKEEVKKETDDPGKTEKPSIPEGAVLIDDDYISKADEKDRAILHSVKGEIMSGKALKNYVNAQRLIGQKAEKINNIVNNPPKFIPSDLKKLDNPTEAEAIKESMINSALKAKYPSLPENAEELTQWEAEFQATSPRQFNRYMKERENYETQVDKDYKDIKDLQENYSDLNSTTINNQVADIEGFIKAIGLDLEKDLGANLKLDDKGFNDTINSLLLDSSGQKLDTNLITFVGNIPIVKPDALLFKFFMSKKSEIANALEQKGRKEGFKAANEKKTITTMANAPVQGQKMKENINEEDVDDIDDPAIIKELLKKYK